MAPPVAVAMSVPEFALLGMRCEAAEAKEACCDHWRRKEEGAGVAVGAESEAAVKPRRHTTYTHVQM